MNRRSFLTTAGAAGAAFAASPLIGQHTNPVGGSGSLGNLVIPTSQLAEAKAMHAVAIANRYKGLHYAQDYYNIASATAAVLAMWKQYQLDIVLRPQYDSVTESMLTIENINVAAITAAVNVYNPAVTQAQMASNINYMLARTVMGGVDYKSQVLQGIRSSGMAGYIGIAYDNAITLGNGLNPAIPKMVADAGEGTPHLEKEAVCTWSAWGLLAAGLAFTVLTVMTDGLDLIAIAGWEAIEFWTGISLTGWATVQAVGCGVH
jgi:hypothetical protein